MLHSRRNFLKQINFLNKTQFFYCFCCFLAKFPRDFGENFGQGCQKCIVHVNGNIFFPITKLIANLYLEMEARVSKFWDFSDFSQPIFSKMHSRCPEESFEDQSALIQVVFFHGCFWKLGEKVLELGFAFDREGRQKSILYA